MAEEKEKIDNELKELVLQRILSSKLPDNIRLSIGNLSKEPMSKQDHNALFEVYKKTTLKEQESKIQKIIELSKANRIILMCFEKNKNECHRGVVSDYIEEKGIGVNHI